MGEYVHDEEKYNRCVEDIGELLQRTVRICQQFEREQIRVHGFTSSQCYVLLELLKHEKLTIQEISGRLKLEISTITRIMDILVRDKMVLRHRSERDKRIVEAMLTAGGQTALSLRESIRDYYRSVIAHLPRGHVREVMDAVERLLTAVEESNRKEE